MHNTVHLCDVRRNLCLFPIRTNNYKQYYVQPSKLLEFCRQLLILCCILPIIREKHFGDKLKKNYNAMLTMPCILLLIGAIDLSFATEIVLQLTSILKFTLNKIKTQIYQIGTHLSKSEILPLIQKVAS